MKTLTAVVTALTVVAFGSTAYAQCMGTQKMPVDQTAEKPVVIPPSTVGS